MILRDLAKNHLDDDNGKKVTKEDSTLGKDVQLKSASEEDALNLKVNSVYHLEPKDFDKDLKYTAIRETVEELGVDKSFIQVLTPLSEIYIPPSNFNVQPYLSIYNGIPFFNPDSKEVSQSSLNGTTLEFRIKFANNSTAEYFRVDDIKVEGVLSGNFSVTVADTFALPYIYGTGNCVNNDTMNLVINPLPIVSAGNDTSICYSDTLLLSNGTPLGGTWTGTGIPANSSKFIGSQAGVGLHTIYYSYEDSNTCKNIDSMVVNVWALPLVNAGNDTILCNQPGVVDFDGNFTPGYWLSLIHI